MNEYISREAVFDEIRFQRELAESDGESSVVDTCDAMLHNLREIETADVQPVNQEIIELLSECRETIFGATYTSGEEYTYAITLCDKISAVIGGGKQ